MSVGRVDSVEVRASRTTPGGISIRSFSAPGVANFFDGTEAAALTFLQSLGLSEGASRKAIRQGREVYGIVVGARTVATFDTTVVSPVQSVGAV